MIDSLCFCEDGAEEVFVVVVGGTGGSGGGSLEGIGGGGKLASLERGNLFPFTSPPPPPPTRFNKPPNPFLTTLPTTGIDSRSERGWEDFCF